MSLTYQDNGTTPIARVMDTDLGSSRFVYYSTTKCISQECKRDFLREPIDPLIMEDVCDSIREGMSFNDIASMFNDEVPESQTRSIEVEEQELVSVMPNSKSERGFCAAKSGLGKSTVMADFAMEYKGMNPENEIYLFCRTGEDPAYEGIDIMEKVMDSNASPDDVDEMEMFKDSLVIFDDMDAIPNKKLKDRVHHLMSDIMQNGRKLNITVFYLTHVMFNYTQTRVVINEADKTFFFNQGNAKHIRKYLTECVGLDKRKVDYIMNLESRWTCINILPPKYIITEKLIMLL